MDGPQNKSEEYPWVYKIQYAFKNLKLKSDFHLEWESKGIRVNKFIEISFVVNRNVFISENKKPAPSSMAENTNNNKNLNLLLKLNINSKKCSSKTHAELFYLLNV